MRSRRSLKLSHTQTINTEIICIAFGSEFVYLDTYATGYLYYYILSRIYSTKCRYIYCIFFFFFVWYLYLYSAQYLHVLQDSKRYMTHLTVQVQPNF